MNLRGIVAFVCISLLSAAPAALATSPTAAPVVAPLSEAEAQRTFEAAQKTYANYFVAPAEALPPVETPQLVQGLEQTISVFSSADGSLTTTNFAADMPGQHSNLADVNIVVNVENATLQAVLHDIVRQAATQTGPWQVKWRLKPENREILSERVNLTAETTFGQFVDLLTERVRNMSGINLFITSFPRSRVLLVADTYY